MHHRTVQVIIPGAIQQTMLPILLPIQVILKAIMQATVQVTALIANNLKLRQQF